MKVVFTSFSDPSIFVITAGLMLWFDLDESKKHFDYESRSHYYNDKKFKAFFNKIKRK